ncbi:hypothetical protein LABALGNA3A7_09570 [Dellaglioa algida]|nr:hypothetical protein LABALGNA3A7_09570 [Dellaglioa algida]
MKLLTKEQHKFLLENYQDTSALVLAEMLNIKYKTNFNTDQIKQYKARYHLKTKVRYKLLTKVQHKYLLENYRGKSVLDLTNMLNHNFKTNFTVTQINAYKARRNLVSGLRNCENGTERITNGYTFVKITEGWYPKQKMVWEQANGPLSEDKILIFADRNTKNCELTNLLVATKRDLAMMNGKRMSYSDPELTKTALNIVRLQQVVDEKEAE